MYSECYCLALSSQNSPSYLLTTLKYLPQLSVDPIHNQLHKSFLFCHSQLNNEQEQAMSPMLDSLSPTAPCPAVVGQSLALHDQARGHSGTDRLFVLLVRGGSSQLNVVKKSDFVYILNRSVIKGSGIYILPMFK